MLIIFFRKNDFENDFKKSEDVNASQFLIITIRYKHGFPQFFYGDPRL